MCLGSTVDDGRHEMPLRETAQEEAGTVLDRPGQGGPRAEAMRLSRGFTSYLLPEVVGRRFRCSGLSGFLCEKINAAAD